MKNNKQKINIEKQKEIYIVSNNENERVYVEICKNGKMSVMPFSFFYFEFKESDPERVKRIAELLEEAAKIGFEPTILKRNKKVATKLKE